MNKQEKKRGDIVLRTIDGVEYQYKILFSGDEIRRGIRKISSEIYNYCRNHTDADGNPDPINQVVFVAIANGGNIFALDAERAVYSEADAYQTDTGQRYNIEIKSATLGLEKNYIGDKQVSKERIITMKPKPELIKGKHVFLFDNLQTTGGTMEKAVAEIKAMGAKRVYVCVCVDTIHESTVQSNFYALHYKQRKVFLYGYGLDDQDALRADKYIYEKVDKSGNIIQPNK